MFGGDGGGGERKRKHSDKGRKIGKYRETLQWGVEKHWELPRQMYSNTLFDTHSLRTTVSVRALKKTHV